MPTQDIKTVLRTFHEVFPYVYVWSALSDRNRHALIAGSDRPLQVDVQRFRERFERFARKDLEPVYLDDPAVFLACHLSKVEAPDRELDEAPLSTDYSPVLRFMYSRMYGPEDIVAGAFRVLRARRDSILSHLTNAQALPDSKEFLAKIARLDDANDHLLRALSASDKDLELRDTELARAVELAPELPAGRLVAEERKAVAALTPDQIRALSVRELKDRARRLVRQRAYDKALLALQEWAAREPASAEPCTALGTVYMLMQQPEKAVPLLGEAVRLDPHAADAQFSLGVACVRMGRVAQGLPHLEEAVKLAPDFAEGHAHLGTAFGLVDDAARALPHLRRAVELDPDLADAQCNLGVLLFRTGNHKEAIAHLEKSLDRGLNRAGTHRMLAEAYREAGDERAAALHLKAAEQADSRAEAPDTLR
jgi:Tfp pilus assembly protein PilF